MESTVFISIPKADLQGLIIDCVNTCLKHVPEKAAALTDDQRFYGDKELGKYLTCSVQTVQNLKKKELITFHRMGRRCYFLRSEIDRDLLVKSRRFGSK